MGTISFNRIVVISLKRRPDRLKVFNEAMQRIKWPKEWPDIDVFPAFDGTLLPVPSGALNGSNKWTANAGAWGCMLSHRAILQRAILDGLESIMILEDDAVPCNNFDSQLPQFLEQLPNDWEAIMFGGQHVLPYRLITPGVVKCSNCQRTHAYALKSNKVIRELYAMWQSFFGHCDHAMGPFLGRYNTYAPEPFLFGQERTFSDIVYRTEPARFWSKNPTAKSSFILLTAPSILLPLLRTYGLHTGYHRDFDDIDTGLRAIFEERATNRVYRLKRWATIIREEAAQLKNGVAAIWYPVLTPELRLLVISTFPEIMEVTITKPEEWLERSKTLV